MSPTFFITLSAESPVIITCRIRQSYISEPILGLKYIEFVQEFVCVPLKLRTPLSPFKVP